MEETGVIESKFEDKNALEARASGTPRSMESKLAGDRQGVIERLSDECMQTRSSLQEKAQILFQIKQNYMKKLEVYKHQKSRNQKDRKEYYQEITTLALKDAELKFQRQQLLNEEISWNEIFLSQLDGIAVNRQRLVAILDQYRQLRQQISSFQSVFHFTTEDIRIHTLNSIVFCNYSKSIIDQEIRKNYLLNKLFQQKKEMMKFYYFYQEQLQKQKKQLRDYQINKINIFRRYERIYVGKSKEMVEQQQLLASTAYNYQYLEAGRSNVGGNGEEDDDNIPNHLTRVPNAHPPNHPPHSRPSMKSRSPSLKGRNKSFTNAPATNAPYVPYGPTATIPNFSNPFAIEYGSPGSLLPPEEQEKLQIQQQQEQEQNQKSLTSSLMYQLMNDLEEEDSDEENLGYNKDSLEHRIARRIIIMDMPELMTPKERSSQTAENTQSEENGAKDRRLPAINPNHTNTNNHSHLHHPNSHNATSAIASSSSANKSSSNKAQRRGVVAEGDSSLPGVTASQELKNGTAHPPPAATALTGGTTSNRNRRLSIVQHSDFIQFVDRFNKSRKAQTDEEVSGSMRIPQKTSSNIHSATPIPGVGEKSSVLSFPDYPSKKTKKRRKKAKATDKQNPVIIYDPEQFAEVCAGDYIRPNTILDVNKGIGEREERLMTLVDHCCVAKGKVGQLTAIKEGLNRELMKQACILLTILSDLVKVHGSGGAKSLVAEQLQLQSLLQNSHLQDVLSFLQSSSHHQRLYFDRKLKEQTILSLKEKVGELLYSTTKNL